MRGGKGALAVLVVLAALFVGVASAAAETIKMRAAIEPNGTGRIHLDYVDGTGPFLWEACTSEVTECKKLHGGHEISTEGVAAGTVLRVKSPTGQGLAPEWRGRLRQVAPPTVAGTIEANQFVSPVPGEWSGGWAGEGSEMQLAACVTPTGEECTSLTALHYARSCPRSSSFAIDPRFVGRYLRVADKQPGAGPIAEPAYAVLYPSAEEVWPQTQNTSVAIVGQIAAATAPSPGECGPPPPPRAMISAAGIARVECGGGCTATLIGTHRGHKAIFTRKIRQQDLLRPEAGVEMQLTRSKLSNLGGGKVKLVVEVGGVRLAQRTISTPGS